MVPVAHHDCAWVGQEFGTMVGNFVESTCAYIWVFLRLQSQHQDLAAIARGLLHVQVFQQYNSTGNRIRLPSSSNDVSLGVS